MVSAAPRLSRLGFLLWFMAVEPRAETPPTVLVTGASAAADSLEPTLRPLPWLGKVCSTSFLPQLSGGWVFGCNSNGLPDKALHASTGEQLRFSSPTGPWGISDGLLLDLHGNTAFVPGEDPSRLTPISSLVHAPLSSGNGTVVFSGPKGIETMLIDGQLRHVVQGSSPAPWYRPALNDHGVFWVEIHEGKEEIHWKAHNEEAPRPFARGERALRHVAAEGDLVAWVSDTTVFLRNLATGVTQEYRGEVHSNEALALSGSLLCYEALGGEDLDIFCNNGFHLQRPGHQRRPSLWGEWLVFHEGEQALLYGPIK